MRRALEEGCELTYGDKDQLAPEEDVSKGNYFTPVVLENCPAGSVPLKEELFGPVFVLIKYGSDEQAIEIANDTDYGLSSTIFTTNSD